MKEILETRKADLTRAIEQSVANHNGLLGRLAECEFQLSELEKQEPDVEVNAPEVHAEE